MFLGESFFNQMFDFLYLGSRKPELQINDVTLGSKKNIILGWFLILIFIYNLASPCQNISGKHLPVLAFIYMDDSFPTTRSQMFYNKKQKVDKNIDRFRKV